MAMKRAIPIAAATRTCICRKSTRLSATPTCGVTRVAIRTVVDIVPHISMGLIHAGLLMRMARDTREDGVVVGVGVAIAARGPHSRMAAGINGEPGVVEVCALPTRGRVTRRARGREMCGDVIGIIRALVVRLVARITVRRGMNVIVVDVAAGARNFDVGPGQRELGFVVIKGCGLPRSGVVAHLARRGKSGLLVGRIIRALVILHVATGTCGIQPVEVSICVAALALQLGVRPSQRKSGT